MTLVGEWGRPRESGLRRLAREQRTAWLLVAVLAMGSMLRLRLLSVPFDRNEGEYAYAAQLILEGIVPYDVAYTMKLPGVSTLYAAFLLVFGQSHESIHFGLLLVNVLTGILIFALGRRLVGPFAGVAGAGFFALLSTLPAVQGLWANAEHFVLPFALGGVLAFLHWLDARRDRVLLAAGGLLGTAIVMNQHGAAFFVFVAAVLLFEIYIARSRPWIWQWRPVAVLCLGAAIPIVLLIGVVAAFGNIENFWFWTFEYSSSYATGNSWERGWANFTRNGVPLFEQSSVIGWMALVGPCCLDWSPARRVNSARLCGFAILSCVAVCPGLFFRPHDFVLLLPAVGLLAGSSLDRCHRLLCELSENGMLRAAPGVLAAAMLLVTISVNQDDLLHATPKKVLRSTYGMNPFSESVDVGKWLHENTRPEDRIAVIGSEPQIYFYAQRKSATGYIYTYPLMENQPDAESMQREMAGQIEAAAPSYLVYVHDPSSWMISKQSRMEILEWFWEYQKQYRVVGWSEASMKAASVRWEAPAVWPPTANAWMAVYQRIPTGPTEGS